MPLLRIRRMFSLRRFGSSLSMCAFAISWSSIAVEKNPNKGAKLNAQTARQIREAYAGGADVLELASRFGVSDQAIKDVLNFETWASAGGPRKPVK
jgi:hypothetical protein